MFALLFIGVAAAVVFSGVGGAAVKRVSPKQGSAQAKIIENRDIKIEDPWSCVRAKKQPVPAVPAQLARASQSGGPIAMAIVAMYSAMRQIFLAMGAKKVCTVRGGRYVMLMTYPRLPARQVHVWIEPIYSNTPGGEWHFSSAPALPSSSVEVPLVERLVGPSDRDRYLMNGGEPPGDLWPHLNTAQWQASVQPPYDEPKVDVLREGNADALTLAVWLPPRAPRSKINAFGKRVVLNPITWRIRWMLVTEEGLS